MLLLCQLQPVLSIKIRGGGFCAWLGTLRETQKTLSILVGEGETCETFKLVPPPDSEITLFDSNSACFKVNPYGPIDNAVLTSVHCTHLLVK